MDNRMCKCGHADWWHSDLGHCLQTKDGATYCPCDKFELAEFVVGEAEKTG